MTVSASLRNPSPWHEPPRPSPRNCTDGGARHAHALNTLGNAFLAAGHADSALAVLQEAQMVLEDRRDSHPTELAYTLGLSMNALRDLGKYDESEQLGRESLELYAQSVGRDQPDYAWSLVGLSITLEDKERLEEAEAAQREALTIHEKDSAPTTPMS